MATKWYAMATKWYAIPFLVLALVTGVRAGYNPQPKINPPGKIPIKISMEQAIRQGLIKEVCYAGGVDMRRTHREIDLSPGIHELDTDPWPKGDTVDMDTLTASGVGWCRNLIRVDAAGDSLTIWLANYAGAKVGTNHNIVGLTSGTNNDGYIQVFCSDPDRFCIEGDTGHWAVSGIAAQNKSWAVDSSTVQSADSVVAFDHWYQHRGIGANDTIKMEVQRWVKAYKEEPYFIVRYQIKKESGSNRDSIRYAWVDTPLIGRYNNTQDGMSFNENDAQFDIGYMYQYGRIEYEGLFEVTDLDSCIFMMLNVGSRHDSLTAGWAGTSTWAGGPGSTWTSGDQRDTLLSTTAACLTPDSLGLDFGVGANPGTARIVGLFVAFNPTGICPTEICYKDTTESWIQCDFEGAFAQYDTTWGYGNGMQGTYANRSVFARTDKIELSTTTWAVIEYAVGVPRFPEQQRPWWPMIPTIKFSDGVVLAPSYYRKR